MMRIIAMAFSAVVGSGLRSADVVGRSGAPTTLRVCNAYPYDRSLDVYRGPDEQLTVNGPLAYKQCSDLNTRLVSGDKLEFRVGTTKAGTFTVSEVPDQSSLMMLVIYRHDTFSTDVSFASHVFARLRNAQVAVIDTYRGGQTPKLTIKDNDAGHARSEELRFNAVAALNHGDYLLEMAGAAGPIRAGLEVDNGESYVILRTGVAAQGGLMYPEELMVFPARRPQVSASSSAGAVVVLALALWRAI
mmetsp:Transcript_58141/g.127449  ORF Transcript_58141/g.127449 Transcript_58141/m.127449 type:complete len:246 (-) Transcript_58141:6-743(-)|eukprot:CAMPEP_0204389138 /NCGR_PEP_ID=MMETSP0469-20131031/59930_1 /ASSEMBLY_ACC=CAM_ASM_000384 /TAXON_ID=2969 /ORGANISM="Oxyrrhis marina" /LENGTH=245 /DNA_ID=CAMNT_0051382771 /DNA_START=156 /DNA_END=893 /DNA_ORIENTATION=-